MKEGVYDTVIYGTFLYKYRCYMLKLHLPEKSIFAIIRFRNQVYQTANPYHVQQYVLISESKVFLLVSVLVSLAKNRFHNVNIFDYGISIGICIGTNAV